MPPLPVIPRVLRVALEWSGDAGQRGANVIHIESAVAGSAAQVMAALDAHVTSGMWGPVCDAASITVVNITPLDGVSATQSFTPATPAHWTGGTGGGCFPAEAAIVKLTTGLRGRSHRGRIFLPFIAEAAQDDGVITGMDVVQTAWDTFNTDMLADIVLNAFMVVASYKLGTASPVASFLGEVLAGTQRRRMERIRGA
jgi:hypothetical protein